MPETIEIVHVAWGASRAETIREALRVLGCEARVIALPGALTLGPINPPDPDVRQAWIRTVLRCDPEDDRREDEQPWTEATAAHVHPVYWVCMTEAAEQASLLEFAFRMAGRPFDIIDATGLDFVTRDGVRAPWSLGIMRRDDIVRSGLKDRQRPVSRAEGEAAATAWAHLRSEDAPLRILREGRLVSAPLTHYDDALVSQAAAEWEAAARLIGRTLHHLALVADPPERGVSDIVLFGRVQALGDSGRLDIRGAGPGLRDYEVRGPAAPPRA